TRLGALQDILMPPSKPAAPSARPTPSARRSAETFRAAIEKGTQEGYSLDDMLLRLTLGDASELKRDRSLAIEDISFKDGVMRFLGVKVAPGGITTSRLDCGEAALTPAV
ncbi:MAG TPA: hypothetical protein VD906_12685, partial [Caulobacteraceae bacterium]|nr:hypothetical protein [Caulobacteraceae bacterium]